jgi:hypothetical protein
MRGEAEMPADYFLAVVDLVTDTRFRNARLAAVRARSHLLHRRSKELRDSTSQLLIKSESVLTESALQRGMAVALRLPGRPARESAPPFRHALFEPGFAPRERQELLYTTLDAALTVAETDLGLVHLLNPDGVLHLEAYRGFAPSLVHQLQELRHPQSPFSYAVSLGEQVCVTDLALHCGDSPEGQALLAAGGSAIVVTPLVVEDATLGVLSTELRDGRDHTSIPLDNLGAVARQAARWLKGIPA